MNVLDPAALPAHTASSRSPLRHAVALVVHSKSFSHAMALLIVLNGAALGLQTYPALIARLQAGTGVPVATLLDGLDAMVIAAFGLEAIARLFVDGRRYFRDRWNLFDLAIVLLTVASQAPALSGLRVLRVVRVLRLLTGMRSLRLISAVIFKSLSGSMAISSLLLLLLFVFALIGHGLFGQAHPELFGNLHTAMYTLFRVAAFYAVDDVAQALVPQYPWAYLVLVPCFMLMSYVVLNFFSAIVVYYLYEFSFEDLKRGQQATTPAPTAPPPAPATTITPSQHEQLLAEIRSLREDLRRQATATAD